VKGSGLRAQGSVAKEKRSRCRDSGLWFCVYGSELMV
jgi:hypothetical protein